jgi:hypothetical protein
MFKKQEKFDRHAFKEAGFVMCEHSKLWGMKRDMVEKTILENHHMSYSIYPTKMSREVYFSPAFAPEWDIQDRTEDPPKCIKIIPQKEVEIKCK